MADVTIYVDGETGNTHASVDAFTTDSIINPLDPTGERLPVPKQALTVSAPDGIDLQFAAGIVLEAVRQLRQRRPEQAGAVYASITIRSPQ